MLGLTRGTVALFEHEENWIRQAKDTIDLLKRILGETAVDVQHVGSTAVLGLMTKPIIDIAIGVRALDDLNPFVEEMAKQGVCEAGQDLPGQRLFVMGDFDKNTRTHHIHVVVWGEPAWKHYIRFRDYLRTFSDKRAEYEADKRRLAAMYPDDRSAYTAGKAALIDRLLQEADRWSEGKKRGKAIMLCGKIASGKSVYAEKLCAQKNAVLLSVDELVLSILGNELGGQHDEITKRVQAYLLNKSLQVIGTGADAVLDWGFWTKESRFAARGFYERHGIPCEIHYVDVTEDVWRRNIEKRNRAVFTGRTNAYFVSDGLIAKLEAAFEPPARDEIDVRYVNDWQ